MVEVADVVVIGGGSTGASIAWHLARGGAGRVVLVEKNAIAAGGTGWSSGIVRQHYAHETLARMARTSLGVFEHFAEIVGGDADFHRAGFLVLVQPSDVENAIANVAMQRGVGIDVSVLTPAEIAELEPRMTVADIGGAAWEPGAGYADPASVANGFAAAARREGAELLIGVHAERIIVGPRGVEAVETSAWRIAARTVVVAAGFRSRELVAPLGVDLPITPIRHDVAIVERTAGFGASHPTVVDLINGSYMKPEGSGMTLIGMIAASAGVEDPEVEQVRDPTPAAVLDLATRFCRRFPTQDGASLRRGYTGIYDCTPDQQPLLGPTPSVPGLHLATGFSGHGFKLSPVVGAMIAERIISADPGSAPDLDLFSPARFAEGRPIRAPHAYTSPMLG
jgi:sarcosine oxidase, subunit beta